MIQTLQNELKTALVVPTIREDCISDFIGRWSDIGLFEAVHLVVMEDNPTKTFDLGTWDLNVTHLCWEDIEKELGKDSWIIPRRSDTVRSYAYYWAWKNGRVTLTNSVDETVTTMHRFDYVATLDDDCYPPTFAEDGIEYESAKQFFQSHINYMTGRTKWFNTLNSVKPRGVPFENRGSRNDIVLNHGLWTNVLDYDAPTQLVDPKKEDYSFDNDIVPHGSYFPMCGMNVCWRREYTPWMYHLLMGRMKEEMKVPEQGYVVKPLPFDRFGDIWCGVFFKRLADLKGLSVSTGLPYIRHERASNPWTNLKKEGPGLPVNEKLWEHVDDLKIQTKQRDPARMYAALADRVSYFDEFSEYADYFKRLGEAMQIWAELFIN
jgi:hypothetical protein